MDATEQLKRQFDEIFEVLAQLVARAARLKHEVERLEDVMLEGGDEDGEN